MSAAELKFKTRDLLTQAIVECLNSWSEIHRRIFIDTHYCGRSVEEIARTLNLRPSDVSSILQQCERRLHESLKVFRECSRGVFSDASCESAIHPFSCSFR